MRQCCLIFFLALFLVPAAQAVVIYVPAEQPTIQAGIDAAHDGDIINVVDGVYFGPGNVDLDFQGKAITVRSGNGPDYCVIEPQYAGRAVRFRNGEGRDSVLQGFTIRQGITSGEGAAVLVDSGCSPTIAGNVFSDNISFGRGGAVHCRYGSEPLITGNTFLGNQAVNGGAISAFNCEPVITANRFQNNHARGDGGGVHLDLSRAELVNNLFYLNSADRDGGGLFCIDGRMTVRCATIDHNTAGTSGGGIRGVHSVVEVHDTILSNDDAPLGREICSGDDGLPSHLAISFSCVRGGYSMVDVAAGSTLTYGDGVIFDWPHYVYGVYGRHYLSNTLAGQTSTSACVDAGSGASVDVTYPGAGGMVGMNQTITRSDEWPDDGQLDMGFHYQPYRRLWRTVEAAIACIPDSGTLPLPLQFWVSLRNISPVVGLRQFAVRVNLVMPDGRVTRQWKAGYTNVAEEGFFDVWQQIIPVSGGMVGDIKFIMVAEDVTSPPYNLPPYPPAGSTDTSTFTVTTFAP